MSVLLDTHALLWWATESPKLSRRAATQIARAAAVLVSPVTFWEIATLVRRRALELDRDPYAWRRDVLALEDVQHTPVTETVAVAAGLLPDAFPGDPADRLLYATARELAVPMISKDRRIREYARLERDLTVLW